MQDKIEIILRFRRIISARYLVYGIVTGLVLCTGILLHFFILQSVWMKSITSGLTWAGLGFLWYLLYHRYQMLWHFNAGHPDAMERLEGYLLEKQKKWFDAYLVRMGGMTLLGLVMLMFLFFWKESIWTTAVAGVFIALILLLTLKGWMDFTDDLLLQDIKHDLRDQTSE